MKSSPFQPTIVLLFPSKGDSFLVSRLLEEKGCQILYHLPEPCNSMEIDAILLDLRIRKDQIEKALLYKRKASVFLPLIALVPERTTVEILYKMGFDDCWHYPLFKEEFLRRLFFFLKFREKFRELKLRERNQRLEALGFLAVGIAHDFNNLLTPISGYTDICILKACNQPELTKHLKSIKDAVQRCRELIDQIFSFCNPAEEVSGPIDLAKEVQQVSGLLRAAVPNNIIFQLKVTDTSLWVEIHPSQIHRLLLNLLTNAIKAIGHHKGKISLEVKKEGNQALIMIHDTGRGLEKGEEEKIFKMFYSSEKTFGIGLNIVKNIVEEAGGHIQVESIKNKGTTFNIAFPLQKYEGEKKLYLTSDLEASGKILVIDDEITILELFKQFLEVMGFKVLTASSGHEALKIFERNKDLVLLICDYFLPDLKGDVLARIIKKHLPALPVIFCTGMPKEIKLQGLEKIRTLKKPFSFAELKAIIHELLQPSETALWTKSLGKLL